NGLKKRSIILSVVIIENQREEIDKITEGKEEKIVKLTQQEEANRQQLQQFKKEENNSLISKISELQGKLEAKEEEKESTLVQEILNNSKDFLGARRIFLNTRQITVKGLKNCYNKLRGDKKYDKTDEVGNIISAVGGVANSLTFGVSKALGEAIITINDSFKRKFSNKQVEEFKELLNNDKESLLQLNKFAVSNSRELKLFNAKHKIFEVIIKEGV
ncbi:827_t:CDS:2, partial [Paraglomus brasilianum]